MKYILTIILSAIAVLKGYAQHSKQPTSKPIIDSAAIANWPSIGWPSISNDGKFILCSLENFPKKDNISLVFQSVAGNWKRQIITNSRGRGGFFTADSKQAAFNIPGDSLCIITLSTDEIEYIAHVSSYQLTGLDNDQSLAYQINGPSHELIIRSLQTGKERHYSGIDSFNFNQQGTILVFTKTIQKDTSETQEVQWVDLMQDKTTTIWRGQKADNIVFDDKGIQLAFIGSAQKTGLWSYKAGDQNAQMLADNDNKDIDSNLVIKNDELKFSKDGGRIFFQLIKKPLPKPRADAIKVDVWNYQDLRLQSDPEKYNTYSFAAVADLKGNKITRLQRDDEEIVFDHSSKDDQAVIYENNGGEGWWNKAEWSRAYWISTIDGSRKIIQDNLEFTPYTSMYSFLPGKHIIIYFDRDKKSWYSYDADKQITINISSKIPYPVNDQNWTQYATNAQHQAVGLGGWFSDGSVLIYDDYDIWKVDPFGKQNPVNITNFYGRQHHLKFRVAKTEADRDNIINSKADLLLSAFNTETKYNGFFRKQLGNSGDPELCSIGPYYTYAENSQLQFASIPAKTFLWKSRNTNIWIVNRETATEAPNYFTTEDFKNFKPISSIQPQKAYNWLTTSLVHFKQLDGTYGTGLLYKPENFDPKRKYPVIFNYYEQRSDQLFEYLTPHVTNGAINIPWFVSRGYLVFVPDVYFKIGHTGESTVNSVVGAAKFLSRLPYVDAKHMGIQGHSFGGFETNYLVTHSHVFAAAAEGAGPTDYVSLYNGLFGGSEGISMQFHTETSQSRIGATLWQRPNLYIENSPVFKADQVTTPFLMVQNKMDYVPFSQGVELFTALRRLNKKVWLLQYDNGGHGVDGNDARDLTTRLLQFFDYYLNGSPPPKWMTEGIPARMKGIDNGLELDTSGKQP